MKQVDTARVHGSKTVAIVTIKEAGRMTRKGRREIARWLRMHAAMLVKEGKNYSKRFTGKYLY